jgi:hypothetical protein
LNIIDKTGSYIDTIREQEGVRELKQKVRLWISFVVAIGLLIFALPRLPMHGTTIQFGFSLLWTMFCLLVIAANLYALLRLGRGETLERPALNKEQKEAIRRLRRYRSRRMYS